MIDMLWYVVSFDMFSLTAETNLPGLEAKVDNLDVDKLKTVPTDLNNLTNAMDNNDI